MKSQQSDQKIRTNCKECVFAIYDGAGITQISCAHNRIDKFADDVVEAYDEEKQFYVIDRLCTYYRDRKWGYNESDIEKVKKESALSFDIVFNANDINEEKATSIMSFINDNEYYRDKISLFIIHETYCYANVKDTVKKIMQNSKGSISVSVCASIEEYMHKLLKKTKNAYHAIIDQPEKLSPNILNRLNDHVNENLNKFIVAECDGIKFIGNFTYKSLNSFNPSINYFKNINEIVNNSIDSNFYIYEN